METLTPAQATSFGNYLLSPERKKIVRGVNRNVVTHADFENWKAKEAAERGTGSYGSTGA